VERIIHLDDVTPTPTDSRACQKRTDTRNRCGGQLDLESAHLAVPMLLDDIVSSEPIALEQVTGSQVSITNSTLSEISAQQLKLDHSLNLAGITSNGPINLQGATMAGDGYLRNGKTPDRAIVPFVATGEVSLSGATIGGGISCTKGSFTNKNGDGLILQSVSVVGPFIWRPTMLAPSTGMDLSSSSVGLLADDITKWPQGGGLILDRFTYSGFAQTSDDDVGKRIDRIEGMSGFHTQPYEHLASVYRGMGRTGNARRVGIAREKARSKEP
jgi:hypothetical protein